MSQRILLASLNAGGGHKALRDAFQTVLQRDDPREETLTAIPWDSHDRFIESFYSFCVHYVPRFQGAVYALSDSRVGMEIATRFSTDLLAEARDVLHQEQPDAVISTHPVLSMMLVKAKHSLGLEIPVLAAIPDYGVPSASFHPPDPSIRPDGLIVMSEETHRHYLQTEGLPAERLHLSGFTVRREFEQLASERKPADRVKDRKRFLLELETEHPEVRALDPAKPTVLFMGGSAWTAKTRPVLETLFALPEFASSLNVIVVCGRDKKFQEQITAGARPWKNFAIFGFVAPRTLAQLMALADVPVLGSLAPATMQELLEVGCGPLLLHHYIPGTEQPHTHYIQDHRIGRYEPDPSRMVDLLMQATGFAAAQPPMRELLRSFPLEARRIRSANRMRAAQLPDFLRTLLGVPASVVPALAARTQSQSSFPALRS